MCISLSLGADPTEFEIVNGTTDFPLLVDGTNTVVGIPGARIVEPANKTAPPASDDERRLGRVNQDLKRAGYLGPALGPRVTYSATGTERFRLLLYDYAGGGLGGFDPKAFGTYHPAAGCGLSQPTSIDKSWISINSGKYTGGLYNRTSKLTHELFHAYEYAHPMFQSSTCPNDWIREGLADAVANFITEQAFRVRFEANRSNFNRASLRSYRIAFQDENDWLSDDYFQKVYAPLLLSSGNEELRHVSESRGARAAVMYLTSGFWQFLARRSTGIRPDYASPVELSRLLAAWQPLLQHQSTGHVASGMGWLRVVNKYVADSLPLEKSKDMDVLYGWLPEFFTEYASWWHLRHRAFSKEFWMKHAFGGCEKVELKPGRKATASSKKITISEMAKNSARCIDVKLSGFSNSVSLEIRADNFGSTNPDQFHLGLAHIDVPGGISPYSCWNKHHDSRRLECRRLAIAEQDGKAWKAEQITVKTLETKGESLDATLTYVFSNVSPKINESSKVETVDLTFAATYNFGGNKKFAPPGSIRPMNPKQVSRISSNKKETFYRLYTSAASKPTNLFDIELNELKDGEQPRCGGDKKNTYCAYDTGGDYYITPGQEVQFGQLGPIYATVHKNANGGSALMSTYCSPDADHKAVEILDSSDEGLVIRVNTELCDIPSPQNDFCNKRPTCPVRDHLLTTLTLGLGREHFADTAPIHIATPGTRFDMDLYFRFGVPTESFSSNSDGTHNPGASSESGPAGSSPPPGQDTAQPGTQSGSGGMLDNCACTCEERENMLLQAEDLKARAEAAGSVSGAAFMDLMTCSNTCKAEYVRCEMAKDNTAGNSNAKPPDTATPPSCDCSCAALSEMNARTEMLLNQYQGGDLSALDKMQQLGECIATCGAAISACAKY